LRSTTRRAKCLPRMRGDRPSLKRPLFTKRAFTPHARGSTLLFRLRLRRQHVYPACAGIDRDVPRQTDGVPGLPRMRGDRPKSICACSALEMFTPHARGSTAPALFRHEVVAVYPACAGIDRQDAGFVAVGASLPRMRGDRPRRSFRIRIGDRFTPHARGSTSSHADHGQVNTVYPACAGIDRFQTIREVFRQCLPRMRGDRPIRPCLHGLRRRFTPHARGSTHISFPGKVVRSVYPACAGIDRSISLRSTTATGLPRMRGDRPTSSSLNSGSCMFTPHARGSTPNSGAGRLRLNVYPACAGIDLFFSSRFKAALSLPRMRGDRPTQN